MIWAKMLFDFGPARTEANSPQPVRAYHRHFCVHGPGAGPRRDRGPSC